MSVVDKTTDVYEFEYYDEEERTSRQHNNNDHLSKNKRRRRQQSTSGNTTTTITKPDAVDSLVDNNGIGDDMQRVLGGVVVQTIAAKEEGEEGTPLPPPPPPCWKCHGTGKKFRKRQSTTKRQDNEGSMKCGVCNGLGYRPKSKQSQQLSAVPGKIQSLRGYPPDHPKRLRLASSSTIPSTQPSQPFCFSGPRAVWGRSRFERRNKKKKECREVDPTALPTTPTTTENQGDEETEINGQDKNDDFNNVVSYDDWEGLPDELKPNPGEIVASLGCGDWRIYQLSDGNKLTVDDFVCAWVACEEMNDKRKLRQQHQQMTEISSATVLTNDKEEEEEEDFMFGGVEQKTTTTTAKDDDKVSPPTTSVFSFTHADLGTGCGSVLQMVLWAFLGQIRSVGVEAQDVSYQCLRRGLMWNVGCDPTQPNNLVRIVRGDLRTWDGSLTISSSSFSSKTTEKKVGNESNISDDAFVFSSPPLYDLITGTPPYFPIDSFVASNNHHQKVRCRIPTRGGATDYVKTASRLLADDGVFCMVEASFSKAEESVLNAVSGTNGVLKIKRRIDVITRTGLKPRFSCWVMTKPQQKQQPQKIDQKQQHKPEQEDDQSSTHETEAIKGDEGHDFPIETLTLRDTNLQRTEEYSRVMERMGWIDFEKYKKNPT